MPLPLFPIANVRGITWDVIKRPTQNTIVQKSVNGREIRLQQYAAPLWEFEFTWEFITNRANDIQAVNSPYTDYQAFLTWLLNAAGQAQEFVYQPPDSAQNLVQLTPDANGNAQLVHYIGTYPEPVQEVNGGTIQVFFNNVLQSNPSIAQPSSVAPYLGYVIQNCPPGQTVTASFSYFYRCRLLDDKHDLVNWAKDMYKLDKVKLTQVRL